MRNFTFVDIQNHNSYLILRFKKRFFLMWRLLIFISNNHSLLFIFQLNLIHFSKKVKWLKPLPLACFSHTIIWHSRSNLHVHETFNIFSYQGTVTCMYTHIYILYLRDRSPMCFSWENCRTNQSKRWNIYTLWYLEYVLL